MSSSTLSISSNEADGNNKIKKSPRKIKRYHKFLYPDFQSDSVCQQTLQKYETILSSGTNLCQLSIDVKELPAIPAPESDISNDDAVHDDSLSFSIPCSFESDGDETNNSFINRNYANDQSDINDMNKEVLNENNDVDIELSDCNYSDNSSVITDEEYLENSIFDEDLFFDNDVIINDSESYDENEDNFYDRLMFDTCKLTVRHVIILMSSFSLRFHLSDEAQLELMKMFQVCAGSEFYNVNMSKYRISKCLPVCNKHISYDYYCVKCKEKVIYCANSKEKRKKEFVCEACQERYTTAASNNYFLTVDLSYQLEMVLNNPINFDDIMSNVKLFRKGEKDYNKIKGVYNSEIYTKIIESNEEDEKTIMLTLNANTDGAPTTKSGKTASWALLVTLNELSPKLRSRYVLLAGILMAVIEPDCELMNLYLTKFVQQMINLYRDGLVIKRDGKEYLFKFCILGLFVDTVCRRIMQNRMQFNGYSGCSWCYQLGKLIKSVCGVRYVVTQLQTERTHGSHLEDIRESIENKKVTNGVKGDTVLKSLPHIDLVWSFGYEYMHALLLGIARQIFSEWKSGNCKLYHLELKDLKKIEQRYLSIRPIQEIQRLPRPGVIVGNMKKKASEEKFWLLGTSLPCLNGILNDEALHHFSLLVNSAYTLLKSEISFDELEQCERDLLKFVVEYEMYYGEEKMTFNIHAALHAVKSLKMTGPFCYNSAFIFESYIGTLKKYISGPHGMDYQMAKKHIFALIFKSKNTKSELSTSEEIETYCAKLFMPKKLRFYEKEGEVTFCGRSFCISNELGNNCLLYKKCIFEGNAYHSVAYPRICKTDDTVIKLKFGGYYRIVEILKFNHICYLRLSSIEVCPENPFSVVKHLKKVHREAQLTVNVLKPITDVLCKVIYMKITSDSKYLFILPNNVEVH